MNWQTVLGWVFVLLLVGLFLNPRTKSNEVIKAGFDAFNSTLKTLQGSAGGGVQELG